MGKSFDAMVAGHLCLDVIPQFPETGCTSLGDLLRPGKLVEVGGVQMSTGGAVSNTGIAMSRLGGRVCFSARVGDDAFGRLTLDIMQRNGNTEGIHPVRGSVSSYTVVIAPPHIDRVFLHNPGANNEFGSEDLDPALIAQCRLFHFGYPPLMARMYRDEGEELARVFKLAKEAGATTSCDMALPDPDSEAGRAPWKRIFEKVLPYVDIFLPSIEEAYFALDPQGYLHTKEQHAGAELIGVIGPDTYSGLASRLMAMGAKIVVVKSGRLGLFVKTAAEDRMSAIGNDAPANPANWSNRELWCPSFRVAQVASATGAGDSAIAGLLTSLLRGRSIEQALRTANCLGWQNVQVLDATSGIHTWDETQAILEGLHDVSEIAVMPPEWHWKEADGIWASPRDGKPE